jgi:phosphoribosyl 1,2-cyclic phosphate phosphodiesterase
LKPPTDYPPLKIRVLGSGTSMGVPVIGCRCPVCLSTDPHNKRWRSSISIEAADRHILIDCSIDFRTQMLQWPMPRIDAVLITHTHSDHINGIDDLRSYNYLQKGVIPLYTAPRFIEDLRHRFNYCFDPPQRGGGLPDVETIPVEAGVAFSVGPLEILPVEIMHGRLPIIGFRLDRFAYLTDCSGIPPQTEAQLQGLEVLIISALRLTPHPTHFNLEQALEASGRLGARRVFFTHIADEMDHETTNRGLPQWARLLYDGQVIEAP